MSTPAIADRFPLRRTMTLVKRSDSTRTACRFWYKPFRACSFFDVAGAVSLDVLTNERFKSALWANVNAGWLHEMTFGAFFRKFFFALLSCAGSSAFMPSFVDGRSSYSMESGSRGDAQCHCDQKSGRHLSGCSSQSAAQRLQPANFTFVGRA